MVETAAAGGVGAGLHTDGLRDVVFAAETLTTHGTAGVTTAPRVPMRNVAAAAITAAGVRVLDRRTNLPA